MDDISLALDPPRFVKMRGDKPPLRIGRGTARVWPLPALNGREPVIMPVRNGAPGVELAYARANDSDLATVCRAGTPNGTDAHVMPQSAAVLSIGGGVITFAGRLGEAFALIIDHGHGWASHYRNLKSLACIRTDLYSPREQHVHAGKTIGYVGAPAAGEFRRLYFEVWRANRDRLFVPIDPRSQLVEWKPVNHHDHLTPAPPTAQKEAA